MNLRFPTLSAAAWVTVQLATTQAFGILIFAAQAPLLGPHAFGLVAIVLSFIGVAELLLGDASAEVLISIREIHDLHYETIITVAAGFGVLMGVGFFLGAPLFARWFGDPQLRAIFRVMAVLPVLAAFSSGPVAATKRDMQFRPLAVRSIGGVIVSGLVGLSLTLLGFGVWALVFQAIALRLASVVTLWLAVPIRVRMNVSAPHLRDITRIAGPVLLAKVMNVLGASVPRSILGLYLGVTEVGFYSLATRLSDILIQIAVAPVFSVARVELRSLAPGSAELNKSMLTLSGKMSILCFPISIVGAVLVPTLFHAWLGTRWYDGIGISQLMLLACVPYVTFYCATATLMALNRQGSEAFISVIQTVSASLVAWVSAPFGITVFAASLALRPMILAPLPAEFLRRCGVSLRAIFDGQLTALMVALALGAVAWALQTQLSGKGSDTLALLAIVSVITCIYATIILIWFPQYCGNFLRRLRHQRRFE